MRQSPGGQQCEQHTTHVHVHYSHDLHSEWLHGDQSDHQLRTVGNDIPLVSLTITHSNLEVLTVTHSHPQSLTVTHSHSQSFKGTQSYFKSFTITHSHSESLRGTQRYFKSFTITHSHSRKLRPSKIKIRKTETEKQWKKTFRILSWL